MAAAAAAHPVGPTVAGLCAGRVEWERLLCCTEPATRRASQRSRCRTGAGSAQHVAPLSAAAATAHAPSRATASSSSTRQPRAGIVVRPCGGGARGRARRQRSAAEHPRPHGAPPQPLPRSLDHERPASAPGGCGACGSLPRPRAARACAPRHASGRRAARWAREEATERGESRERGPGRAGSLRVTLPAFHRRSPTLTLSTTGCRSGPNKVQTGRDMCTGGALQGGALSARRPRWGRAWRRGRAARPRRGACRAHSPWRRRRRAGARAQSCTGRP